MDLMCAETISQDSCHAGIDVNVFEDERVLQELLDAEKRYVPSCDYFGTVQTDMQPYMRKIVTQWMLEICDKLNCEDQVFPLAVNMFDRYLCTADTPKIYLQRVAANCILLATKIRQAVTISIDTLCKYTNYSVTACEMRAQELLLVEKLKWDLLAITGFDFIDHILQRIRWSRHDQMIRRHSLILLHLCYTECDFVRLKPSTMATACIVAAIKGLKLKIDCRVLRRICALANSPVELVKEVVGRLEWIVAKEEASAAAAENDEAADAKMAPPSCASANGAAAAVDKMDVDPKTLPSSGADAEETQQLTPTDVQDVEF